MSSSAFRPVTYRLRQVLGLNPSSLEKAASDCWQLSPAEIRMTPPAIVLPGHLERIMRTEFAPLDVVLQSLAGDPAEHFAPTMAYLLRDAALIDGTVYAQGYMEHLHTRKRRTPFPSDMTEVTRATMHESWLGNRWFGNWLLDDLTTYPLAEAEAPVVTSQAPRKGHAPDYEARLEIKAQPIGDTHFQELVVFDDRFNNGGRVARAAQIRQRLVPNPPAQQHPGVFLLRGRSGDLRHLRNEPELAEWAENKLGFQVLDPEKSSMEDLVHACSGAKVVMGVEGSQLCHGIAAMPEGATLVTLQPPDRVTTALKQMTDRWQLHFAMLPGIGNALAFHINQSEIAQILEKIYA